MKVVKIIVPPDKSISHRAIMLSAISKGTTRINNLLAGDDCLHTIEAFRSMGIEIKFKKRNIRENRSIDITVKGTGLRGLKKPKKILYVGNSGTTMRILPGILAGQDFDVALSGDRSLSKRPMLRIAKPLRKMGAGVTGRGKKEIYPPLMIHGGKLKAIKYNSKIASAQVKSCIMLASLYAKGKTIITEPVRSRDHTERMLKTFKYPVKIKGLSISIGSSKGLRSPSNIRIPGDISSAAFFIVAGCLLQDKKIVLKDVGLNPTRTGILDILKRMGARITVHESRFTNHEPSGDIVVKPSRLKAVTISPKDVVRAIDEIPIIVLAACFAKGKTVIRGIKELHYKETDRIMSMVTNLTKLGADIQVTCHKSHVTSKEELIVNGTGRLTGGQVSSFGDHRTAMTLLVAGLVSDSKVTLRGLDCINKSFPGFVSFLKKLK
ncbi:MAG: 3-phosphoshikimate 1-carboxyvinyltransferase [Candidatus Omnitrophota bacterium]